MADLADLAEHAVLREQMRHLQGCDMQPGSWDKRFINDVFLKEPANLTENQRNQVRRLAYKYRRQMPPNLVPNRVQAPRTAR